MFVIREKGVSLPNKKKFELLFLDINKNVAGIRLKIGIRNKSFQQKKKCGFKKLCWLVSLENFIYFIDFYVNSLFSENEMKLEQWILFI